MLNKTNNKGSTMMEALAVLCIVGVLGISGMKLIGNLFTMFKQYSVANEIKDIYNGVKNRFSADGNYAKLADMTVQNMAEEKIVPSQMYVSNMTGGKSLFHRLGGEVLISAVGADGDFFQVEFKGLTFRACLELAQLTWSNGGTSDLLSLSIYQDESGDSGITFALPNILKQLKNSKNEVSGKLEVSDAPDSNMTTIVEAFGAISVEKELKELSDTPNKLKKTHPFPVTAAKITQYFAAKNANTSKSNFNMIWLFQ